MRIAGLAAVLLAPALAGSVLGIEAPAPLTKTQQDALRRNWALCLSKLKGPYTENYCVCANGQKLPVQVDGQIRTPCGPDPLFCAAFRAPWAEALGRERVWIANLFAPDLLQWEAFTDHHDLVRGYILEQYVTETNPTHKLAEMRAYGGLAGAEYEAPAALRFFERYLAQPEYDDARHYLLAYELQRRYYVRNDQAGIQKIRNLAIRIQQADARFKPLRDMTHNQLSATLLPKLRAYRDQAPSGAVRSQVDELMAEIEKLVSLDESTLRMELGQLDDKALAGELSGKLPGTTTDPVDAMAAFASIMARARGAVAARTASASDARHLVDVAVTAGALIQRRSSAWLETKGQTARQHAQVLGALTNAAYGSGLLTDGERAQVTREIDAGAASQTPADRRQLDGVAELARQNIVAAFADVWAPWTFLLPQLSGFADDLLQGSPLRHFTDVAHRIDDRTADGRGHLKRRRFVGNVPRSNVTALGAFEGPTGRGTTMVSFEGKLP